MDLLRGFASTHSISAGMILADTTAISHPKRGHCNSSSSSSSSSGTRSTCNNDDGCGVGSSSSIVIHSDRDRKMYANGFAFLNLKFARGAMI